MRKIMLYLFAFVLLSSATLSARTERQIRIGSRINNSTPGSLLFIDLNNKLAEDNANLFWDDTNNRLGIGRTDPSFELDVVGDINANATAPEIRVTSTGDGEHSRVTRVSTSKKAQRLNRVTTPGTPIAGLVGHWKLNDDSADTVVTDFTGNNDLINWQNTNLSSVSGKILKAFAFDGANFHEAQSTSITSDLEVTDLTISAWIKKTALSRRYIVSTSEVGVRNNKFALRVNVDNKLVLIIDSTLSLASSGTITTGVYTHVIGTFDDSANVVSYYIDNVAAGTATSVKSVGTVDAIFMASIVGTLVFDGDIDDLRIYNRVIDSAERAIIFNSGNGTEGNSSGDATLETLVWSSEDGLQGSEKGIQTYGDSSGRTIIDGSDIRINIAGSEVANVNSAGNVMIGSTAEASTLLEIEDGNATTELQISNTATDGDPILSWALSGTSLFNGRIDDGDGDKFKFGTDIISTSIWSANSSGDMGFGTDTATVKHDVNGDIKVPSANAFYFGAIDADGSWRMSRSGDDLLFERRESSSWVEKGAMTP